MPNKGGGIATFIDIIAAVRPNVLLMEMTWKSVRLRSDCSAAAGIMHAVQADGMVHVGPDAGI